MTIAAATKVARALASGNYGYDQGQRWSALGDGKLNPSGELDCSSSTGVIFYLGGFIGRDVLKGTFYTGNLMQKLVATGMFTAIKVSGWSLAKLRANLREGDGLVGPGHVVYSFGNGRILSFENDENGREAGGKSGDQTGREGRIRDLYMRSRGWAYIVRPISPATFERSVLAAYRAGRDYSATLAKLVKRAPFDGPRWIEFMGDWAEWDEGMTLAYSPAALALPVDHHAFVVLGSALHADGTTTVKYRRRLVLAKQALDTFPDSKVLITGGAPKSGMTEAKAGYAYLVAAGVDPARIILEERAASTVGNAKYSMAILAKLGLTTYTLVSDASHLRRATILFAAAKLRIETATNKVMDVTPTTPLAFNDYAPAPVKPEQGVDATTKATVVAEVIALLGL